MRVLICDQESEMLERIAREFDVDVATSKATCVDLMRANPFDVLVASERLSDGSGLELLSSVAARWPDTLRVLAIEPERRRMLGGKLAPFRLHGTIRYPIDEDELEAALTELDKLLGYDEQPDAAQPQQIERPAPQPAPARGGGGSTGGYSAARPAPSRAAPANPQRAAPANPQRPPVAPPPARSPLPAKVPSRHAPSTAPLKDPGTPPRQPVTGKSSSYAASRQPAAGATPPVRRKLGNYTPLGAPEDADLKIVAREFVDESTAPLAARAVRAREEANRPRKPSEKVRSVADHVSRTLKRLLKR